MIDPAKLLYVVHAVEDRDAAEALYHRAFDARTFFRGDLEEHGRGTTLLVIKDFSIALVDVPDELADDPYIKRHRGRFLALGLKVGDLDEAMAELSAIGIGASRVGGSLLAVDVDDTAGLPIELTDRELPNDPRLAADWPSDYWRSEDPLQLEEWWSVSTLVSDVERGRWALGNVIGAREMELRIDGELTASSYLFDAGGANLTILEPKEGNELAYVVERQGPGVHALMLDVVDLTAAVRYMRSLGIAMVGTSGTRLVVHPTSFMGARFLLVERPEEEDPHSRWREWGYQKE
jgi:hypothetical protein